MELRFEGSSYLVRPNKIFKAAVVLLFVGVLQSGAAFSADSNVVTKNPGESDAAFVERATGYKITIPYGASQQLARSSALIKGSQALIAFTEEPDSDDRDPDFGIVMNVLLKKSDRSYAWVDRMEVCEPEGGSASMLSFFFATLDGTANPVVGVICGWDSPHPYADCQAHADVRFFQVDRSAITAVPMEKFEKVLYKQDADGCTVEKFNTVQDIKNLLKHRR
jgi:hypothetical protein